jgi:hypothetical protein
MNSSTFFPNAFKIKTSIFSIFNILEIHNHAYLVTLAYRLAVDFSYANPSSRVQMFVFSECLSLRSFHHYEEKENCELKHLITSNDAL